MRHRTHRLRSPARAALLAALLCAGAASAADLTVELDGIRAATGELKVSVVDSAQGWDGQAAPVATRSTPPAGGTARLQFDGLAPGDYAVLVMHDENGNGQLDTNALGMPLEGYGFSNNPMVMRKATFEEARFSVPAEGARIRIALR
ncbi:hypothetical protein B1992_05275 [Pseudoxanthomonas broegbernensis]|uniref:DUF2141 domain-containing protein n=1 Tax=Pseudoxanthomonas broegbernensis TaxID=83619 RepID=A0A7V8K7Q7_9GAMM|nr:DUF2141 domain-containing protein [Pseudoxanthomonas broegbernensis]KAF1686809.1 hypothetical protein B1992_05275 [Pseudoxanthomonas broegbernensis]MBB6065610.1 uncharacterized protein (DUF2141 family) [Pseudoxanthomonas broegbernensis]